MKYSIFYLLKGNADRYLQGLVKSIGPKYSEMYMIEHPLPSHITLKAPFELRSSKGLENLLEDFAKEHRKGDINIRGFGNFRKFVVIMKSEFSPEAKKIQRELIKELRTLGIEPNEYDLSHHPHSTITYVNNEELFDLILGELEKLKKPEFNLELDRLALMKKTPQGWKVYKEYKLK